LFQERVGLCIVQACQDGSRFPSTHVDVMTELHASCSIWTIGPAHVRLVGDKWYGLVVTDDYSRYAWVLFLEDKGEMFVFDRDLVLRLKNERHEDAIRTIFSDNGTKFKNSHFGAFFHDLGLEH
jgi:transposase InsO family protein